MIDTDGFRYNVGIILAKDNGQLLWARRIAHDGWQFPQGGLNKNEEPRDAMYRELKEEIGLLPQHVKIIDSTPGWFKYNLPEHYQRPSIEPLCVGQKQRWFLLKLCVGEEKITLNASHKPEFDFWCWVDYWYPVNHVVSFKKQVYKKTLDHLVPAFEKCFKQSVDRVSY